MSLDPDRRLAALQFLREWSTWMVGVETVLLGFLVNLLMGDRLALGSVWIKGAAVSFGLSIAIAAWVLGAIPSICLRLDDEQADVYRMPLFDLPVLRVVRLRSMAFLQHAFFFAGIVALIVALVGKELG